MVSFSSDKDPFWEKSGRFPFGDACWLQLAISAVALVVEEPTPLGEVFHRRLKVGERQIEALVGALGVTVEEEGIRVVHRSALVPDSPAEIHIFHVHEETFIEETDLFENGTAEEHETT